MKKIIESILVLALLLSACGQKSGKKKADPRVANPIDYADMTYWYAFGESQKPADVFYVYPTVSTISFADNGSSWFADITSKEVREEANANQRFNEMLYNNYNFYAPYYRQMIFESYLQPDNVLAQNAAIAAKDVNDAFQYYMAHGNGGRPYFLVGHSQGSQMLIELLKSGMTDEQRELMVAAYCIGYHVTVHELARYPEKLCPAIDSTETGKLVVFNSVTDISGIGSISESDVAGVNPTTWTTDTTMVSARHHLGMAKYNETRDSIILYPCLTRTWLYRHTTVCPDLDPEMVFIPAYKDMFPKGNLHFADSWLFAGNVKQNMQCRLRHFCEGR